MGLLSGVAGNRAFLMQLAILLLAWSCFAAGVGCTREKHAPECTAASQFQLRSLTTNQRRLYIHESAGDASRRVHCASCWSGLRSLLPASRVSHCSASLCRAAMALSLFNPLPVFYCGCPSSLCVCCLLACCVLFCFALLFVSAAAASYLLCWCDARLFSLSSNFASLSHGSGWRRG